MKMLKMAVAACLALSLFAGPGPAQAGDPDLLVFAAASTTNAMGDVGKLFEAKEGVKVVNSFASSSNLAKQIAQGAPAHVYLSANVKWMDFVEKEKAVETGTRFNLLRNRIVLIAPKDSKLGETKLAKGTDLAALLGDSRLAMGDPDHVPAGIYAKQALTSLGMWPALEKKIGAAANVRAALALVESGESSLGVVYATDAAITDKVKILGVFPQESHPPIVYPVAQVKGQAHPAAGKYLEFLKSPEAAKVFAKYGFQSF